MRGCGAARAAWKYQEGWEYLYARAKACQPLWLTVSHKWLLLQCVWQESSGATACLKHFLCTMQPSTVEPSWHLVKRNVTLSNSKINWSLLGIYCMLSNLSACFSFIRATALELATMRTPVRIPEAQWDELNYQRGQARQPGFRVDVLSQAIKVASLQLCFPYWMAVEWDSHTYLWIFNG